MGAADLSRAGFARFRFAKMRSTLDRGAAPIEASS